MQHGISWSKPSGPRARTRRKMLALTARRSPGLPAPQEDNPARRETELHPLGAVPALLPTRVAAELGVEPDAGTFRVEHPFIGRKVLRVVKRRGRPTPVDSVARAKRLHRRR